MRRRLIIKLLLSIFLAGPAAAQIRTIPAQDPPGETADRQVLNYPVSFFDRYRDYGAVFIRLIVGWHLVYNVQDNILSEARMLEFVEFLQAHGFPFATLCAPVSVYAQFVCGVLFLLGAFIRPAAA